MNMRGVRLPAPIALEPRAGELPAGAAAERIELTRAARVQLEGDVVGILAGDGLVPALGRAVGTEPLDPPVRPLVGRLGAVAGDINVLRPIERDGQRRAQTMLRRTVCQGTDRAADPEHAARLRMRREPRQRRISQVGRK